MLFTPINLNKLRLENRIVLTAMVTRLSGEDGFVNKDIRDRYLRFAMGEPGLIVMEAMGIHNFKSGPLLRISDDKYIAGLAELARDIHRSSPSKIVTQIIHFLKISKSGWRQSIHDLAREDIKLIVKQYADAAYKTQQAGFDGVELHMAHAYTVSSFLSMRNMRNDEYGSTLENRMRLMSEIIIACRERVGKDFPIGCRYDGEECITDGYGLLESREIALRMAKLGVDWISISAGGKFEDAVHKLGEPLYPYTGYSGDRCMPPATYQDGYNLYLSDGIKKHLVSNGYDTSVVTTGKIRDALMAEEILKSGRADLIGFARTLLADPDWPKKVRAGRQDQIIRCLSINICKALDENFKKVRCYLWPKDSLHPPSSQDLVQPKWKESGPCLSFKLKSGSVVLYWNEATDNEQVYGYEIMRSVNGGDYKHLWSVKGNMKTTYEDGKALGGFQYSYYVRAYDLAGNRSENSNIVSVKLPL